MTERLLIIGGVLTRMFDGLAALGYVSADAQVDLGRDYQLVTEDGKHATGSYMGPGTIQLAPGASWQVTLGDPQSSTQLPTYTMVRTYEAGNAEVETLKGLKAALTNKRPVRRARASRDYLYGFDAGMDIRAREHEIMDKPWVLDRKS